GRVRRVAPGEGRARARGHRPDQRRGARRREGARRGRADLRRRGPGGRAAARRADPAGEPPPELARLPPQGGSRAGIFPSECCGALGPRRRTGATKDTGSTGVKPTRFDYTNGMSAAVGEHGLSEEDLARMVEPSARALAAVQARRAKDLRWLDLPYREDV